METEFIQMVSAHAGLLRNVGKLYGRDEEDRKDLQQEIVLQLWRAFPNYRREAQRSTWIYRIALNTAISLFRRQSRQPIPAAFGDELLNVPQWTIPPEVEERMQQFYTAIEQLSPVEKALELLDMALRNRSLGTVDKMIREVRLAAGILLVIMGFFSAVVAGNPFDYTRPLHFVPAICYLAIAGTGLYFLRQHSHALRQATQDTPDLYHALLTLTQLRVQHTKQMGRVWMLAMLAGSLIMLPVIARKFPPESWVNAVLIALLPIGITAVSIGLARVAGLFTDHHLAELREQVEELEELR